MFYSNYFILYIHSPRAYALAVGFPVYFIFAIFKVVINTGATVLFHCQHHLSSGIHFMSVTQPLLMHFVHSFPRLQRRCKACWQSIPMSQSSLILFLLSHPLWVLTNCGFLLKSSIPCWSCFGKQQIKLASSSVKQLRAEEGSHLNCSNSVNGLVGSEPFAD